ncbi:MAG: glycosyltransferase family 4 protein [Acidimicrobiales bacterium]
MGISGTIGVNLCWLVPGVVGGSEEYTLRLLRAVDRLGDDNLWIRLYGQRELFEAHPDLASRFECRSAPGPAAVKGARIGLEHTWLAAATRGDDIVHHAGGVVPAVRSTPTIVTVHDLQPLEMPQYFSKTKQRWLATMLPRSVRAARLVLCPSEFTAERLRLLLRVPNDKLRVVRHGHEAIEPGVLDADAHDRLTRRFGPFVLLPAISYPHKRHADLVVALDRLRDRCPELSVVMTGRPGPETANLRQLAARLRLQDRVHDLGRVSEEELDALYRSAVALVFPSEYEGFGNPILEAMARGTPVITTDAAALPEVVGAAGITVPTGHPVALADAIARVTEEPDLRRQLSAAGIERATQFSWLDAGRDLVDCYRQALRPT